MKATLLTAILTAAIILRSVSGFADTPTPDKEMSRLDLSVPDLPAIVDLDLSSDKVTRPSTVRDLAASLANGFSADGSFHNGVALEVAPLGLADVGPKQLQAIRVSIATVSTTKAGVTTGKAAAGLRWSVGVYDPSGDPDLASCLADALGPAPALPKTGALPGAGVTPVPAGPETTADSKKIDACRTRFKAAHLAQSAIEVSAAIDGTTSKELRLQDLGTPHGSVWVSGSLGYNSFCTGAAKSGGDASGAYGFQPTLLGRLDFTDTPMGTTDDLFVGVRAPFMWDSFGVFAEYGLTLKDLSSKTTMGRSHLQRFGGGFDLRVANGSWLGVYVGQDVGPNAPGFSFFSNVKFSFGESRKYGLN